MKIEANDHYLIVDGVSFEKSRVVSVDAGEYNSIAGGTLYGFRVETKRWLFNKTTDFFTDDEDDSLLAVRKIKQLLGFKKESC
jgi:hypothetical protein